jgi:thiol-disulfide isomerase/thioredoxin
MKQLVTLTALVGALMCSLPVRANEAIKTFLRGVVPGADGKSFTLRKKGDHARSQTEVKVVGGRFDLETALTKPGFFVFTTSDPVIREFDVYLSPGDDITLSVEKDKVVMSGKGSRLNQFLFDMARSYDYKTNPSAEEVYQARVNAINSTTNTEVLRRKAFLLGYAQGEFLDKVFAPFIESKVHGNGNDINEPAAISFDLTLLPSIVNYHNWHQVVAELLFARMRAGTLKVRKTTSWVADFARAIDNQSLREDYIVEELKHSASGGDYVLFPEVMKEALPLVKDPKKVAYIRQLEDRIKMSLNLYKNALPGTDMSAFTFLRPDSSQVALSDYKGKYVFIDVWATWCKPCVSEIPFLKRLEKELHGQDIVFLSLSIDSRPANWKSFMSRHNMTGEQLIAPSANKDPFSQKIGLAGVPRFLILDKEGRMVNSNCCQRPSNPLLKTYLTELLNK